MLLYITLLLYGTNYFILSEVCTHLRLKSVALMFFPCECKTVFSIQEHVKILCQNHQERRENQKSMSLPSITETKNATLLRIRFVSLAARYTATSPHFRNPRPEAGGHHPQLKARPTAPGPF
jgi:hypothetical protein